MRVVLAPDKFKGCLSAAAVADAIARGVRDVDPSAIIDRCPIADGGEGTVDALVAATGGRIETRRVIGPLPDMRVDASFGILGASGSAREPSDKVPAQREMPSLTAVVEMSAA